MSHFFVSGRHHGADVGMSSRLRGRRTRAREAPRGQAWRQHQRQGTESVPPWNRLVEFYFVERGDVIKGMVLDEFQKGPTDWNCGFWVIKTSISIRWQRVTCGTVFRVQGSSKEEHMRTWTSLARQPSLDSILYISTALYISTECSPHNKRGSLASVVCPRSESSLTIHLLHLLNPALDYCFASKSVIWNQRKSTIWAPLNIFICTMVGM